MEYTYADVIIDPEDPRVEIGKEYWYAANPSVALERANEGNTGNLAVLEGFSKRSLYDPFSMGIGSYPCIIRKKEERPAEFKVGDKVRIVKEWLGWEPYCEPTVGKTGIIRIIGSTSCLSVYLPEDNDWWGYSPDALELIEETAEEKKSYEERQDEWIKANDLKVGDKVRVQRKAGSHENGWANTWVSNMDEAIGNIRVVREFYATGIGLDDPVGYRYPYFVLEKVEDKPRYTEADIIFNPCDPRLAGAIGKRVFYCDGGVSVLADAESNKRTGILDGIENSPWPFTVGNNSWACIIIAKDQPGSSNEAEDKPEYVPFDLNSQEDRDFLRGKWIRHKESGDECFVSAIVNNERDGEKVWKVQIFNHGKRYPYQLLSEYEFLDGSHVGRRKEEA